jgi:hypothetical protein
MKLPNLDPEEARTPSQTDSAEERGYSDAPPPDLGEAEELDVDLDDAGDIADEGPGHRG